MTADRIDEALTLSGRGVRVDFFPHHNGVDVLIVTTFDDGAVESGWGFVSSVDFHRESGLEDEDLPMRPEVLRVAAKRIAEFDQTFA